MLRTLLGNRYLIFELTARNIKSRYVGSVVGLFWSVLNPLVQLALYTVIFSVVLRVRFAGESSAGRFAEYVFCGLLPWIAFQEGITRSATTFLEHANLLKKVRFPLEVLPFSTVTSASVHQLLGSLVFISVLLATGSLNGPYVACCVPLIIMQAVMTFGIGAIVAAFNVFFRDIVQILGVIFMIGFWLTPIVYPKERAPVAFQFLLDLNPLTHMVEAYRWVFLGSAAPSLLGTAYWVLTSCVLCVVGLYILRRTQSQILDLV